MVWCHGSQLTFCVLTWCPDIFFVCTSMLFWTTLYCLLQSEKINFTLLKSLRQGGIHSSYRELCTGLTHTLSISISTDRANNQPGPQRSHSLFLCLFWIYKVSSFAFLCIRQIGHSFIPYDKGTNKHLCHKYIPCNTFKDIRSVEFRELGLYSQSKCAFCGRVVWMVIFSRQVWGGREQSFRSWASVSTTCELGFVQLTLKVFWWSHRPSLFLLLSDTVNPDLDLM